MHKDVSFLYGGGRGEEQKETLKGMHVPTVESRQKQLLTEGQSLIFFLLKNFPCSLIR